MEVAASPTGPTQRHDTVEKVEPREDDMDGYVIPDAKPIDFDDGEVFKSSAEHAKFRSLGW